MRRRRFYYVWAVVLVSGFSLSALQLAGGAEVRLQLESEETAALAQSAQWRAAQEAARASRLGARVRGSAQRPGFSLDATYRHLSEIPSLKTSPLAPEVRLGDNNNYSYGPSVNWMIWDTGGTDYAVRSLRAQADARDLEAMVVEKNVRLATRLAYFRVLEAEERLSLTHDAVLLAESQAEDIRRRMSAGTSSRQDWLQSQAESLDRRAQRREAQADLSAALVSLAALTGEEWGDTARPWPAAGREKAPAEDPVTLWVQTESALAIRHSLSAAADRPFDTALPELLGLDRQAESSRAAARSARSGYGPSVQLSARASRDYPNGPIPEEIQQNTLGAALRWPIWEGGRPQTESAEREAEARSAQERRVQAERDLRRDWRIARDRLMGLLDVETIRTRETAQRREVARLTYESYQSGRVSFLEVQVASLALLKAQTAQSQAGIAVLGQLALLDHWSQKP